MFKKKELEKADENSAYVNQAIQKISKIIFDEKNGTLTLKIASEDEIAEAERLKNEE